MARPLALNLKPQPASELPRLPDRTLANPDIGKMPLKSYRKLPTIIAARRSLGGGGEIERGKETDMRFLSMALALVIVTGSAVAQETRDPVRGVRGVGGEGSGRHGAPSPEQQKVDRDKKKAAEDAYKAALKGIPDSKLKDDPWRGVR
jgi:hypothetical protein